MLELRPLKTFGKMWSSPRVFDIMNVHMSSQRSQDPPEPGPLASSTEKAVVPGVTMHLSARFAAVICSVWELSNSSVTRLLPL